MKNLPIRMHLVIFLFLTGIAFNIQSAELIHGYDFDDDWHISGQLADQVGSVNGTRTGSGSNIPARVLAPASGIKPETCYAAQINTGAFHLDGLGVNTASGGQNSVTFWMYWDGANSVMPFGWHTHDLWFYSGSFGFNSGSGDIFGIGSAGLANGWHHVALVFNNGNLTANKMYIDGVQQTLTQRRRSPNNSNAVAASSATISGWRRSSGYRFDGMLDEVNIYRGEISQAEINAELAASKSCVVPPPPPPPPPAQLKHHYEFDGYWDTTGVLLDSVGATDGSNVDFSPLKNLSPASGIKPNTCYAAEMNNGAFHLDALDVDTDPGGTNTVSFWMYWDGTNSVMPFGWHTHDLWFYGGSFGFNSGSGDIYGIASAGLANGWHHVAAVFNNGNLTANKMYIDGVEQTLTQRRSSPNNSNAVAATSATISGWRRSSGYRFSGSLDEVRIYTGEMTQAQVDAELTEVKTCVITPPPPPVPAVLKHFYEFDDAWEVSGLLTDSEGSVFGNRIGSPSKILAPPNGIKPETCSAAQVNRGAFHLNGLDVDTSGGEANSVTFWIYWDGTNSVMPFGWHTHDLWFYSGSFGFNSGNGDIYGIASAGLANGWHHVAAVFNNGRLRGNSLYIDGVEQTLTQRRSSPNNSRAYAASDATISGWRRSSGYRFSGSLDEVKIYNGKVTQDQVNDDMAAKSCAPVSPYAYFTLDDFDLNGTPGEIVDNMGNANSARAEGADSGVAPNPEGKVCYGVDVPADSEVFPSVAIDTGVDIDSDIGNTGTINFWYRSNESWNSGNARMLFDASKNNASGNDPYFYLLLKNDGKLRFGLEDINDGDVRRDTAAALNFAADQWVHLSVVYSLPLATYKIYVNGVEQALTTVSNSISSSTIGQLDTLYFGDNRSTYFPGATPNSANGRFDEVRIYRSVLTVGQINADMNATHNCKIPPVKEDPAFAFNCVYSGLDPVAGRLYTRVAGSAFNFDVIALEDSNGDLLADGVETNFAKDSDRNITVELVDTSASGNCTTYPVLSPAVSQVVTFTAADAGIKASANMTVNKAYRSVACRVTDATDNPAVVACSSDSFSIRPASLTLDAPVLNNAGFENDPTAKAGESFVLSVTATPGYNGTPAIKAVDPITAHAGGSAGLLSGSFSAANLVTGTATGNTFSYSEVGNFRFVADAIYDDSFTAIDQSADCIDNSSSNTLTAGKVGCDFSNTVASSWIGRFTPDHFEVTINQHGELANTCSGFSYSDTAIAFSSDPLKQPDVTITAKNSSNDTTVNYRDSYAKLSIGSLSVPNITTDGSRLGVDGINNVVLEWNSVSASLNSNDDGTFTFRLDDDSFTYKRNANDLVEPFTADVDLVISSVKDEDDILANNLPQTISPIGVEVRYGRLNLLNAYGSELQTLPMTLQVEYYNGTAVGFVPNTDDSCTVINDVVITDADVSDSLSVAETCIWDSAAQSGSYNCASAGNPGDQFSALPVASNFNLNLMGPGAGNTGVLNVTVNAPGYLDFDWLGGGMTDPTGTASFGLHNLNNRTIFMKEVR